MTVWPPLIVYEEWPGGFCGGFGWFRGVFFLAVAAAIVVERGGFLGGCCAPSAAKTKGNAASGRIRTRFCRHCRTCVHANYLRHTSDLPPARLIYKRVLGDGLLLASILDFRPELGNRCSVIAAAVRNGPPATSVAAKRFSVRFYSSLPQRRTARLLRPSPHRPSASDSILRCRKEEWFRLQQPSRQRVPRPILIFVASKEIRN